MESMESTPKQETKKTPNRARRRIEISEKEAEEMVSRHKEVPVEGLAEPEISPEFVADAGKQLGKLKSELKSAKDSAVIEKLQGEIKELEAFVGKYGKEIPEVAPETEEGRERPERKPTIKTINLQIENLDQELKKAIDRRLNALRSTNSSSFRAAQKEISQVRDELTKLRAEREALREQNKTFVKERMQEALAHFESSKGERVRHKKLAEVGVTLDELKERELNKKDAERWSALLALDAEAERKSDDYARLKSEYQSLEPEAVDGFMASLRAETKTGNLDMQHAAEQIVADIEAGEIAGFTEEEAVSEWKKIKKQSVKEGGTEEAEAKFFSASEKEAHERAEAIETMGPEMTIEEAVAEWEKIKQRSAKGEQESRKEEEAFIDFLHEKYPNYVDFTGKEYSDAKTKPQKVGFFKKLFSFGKPKTRLEEMEEALDNVPNAGKLAGKFLIGRMNRAKKELRPISVKSR